jgi:DNA-binding MarR family transcriptional regulator
MPPPAHASTRDIHAGIERVQRLSDLFGLRRTQLAQRVGITEQQWRVLEEISTEHFMPSMFAKSQDSSAAAVSKVLRQLLDKELVAVSVSAQDGRQRRYELTEQGKQTMASLRRFRQDAIEVIWSRLPRTDLSRFVRIADELIARLERYSAHETSTSQASVNAKE